MGMMDGCKRRDDSQQKHVTVTLFANRTDHSVWPCTKEIQRCRVMVTEELKLEAKRAWEQLRKKAHAFVVAVADADDGERIRGDYRLPACLGS